MILPIEVITVIIYYLEPLELVMLGTTSSTFLGLVKDSIRCNKLRLRDRVGYYIRSMTYFILTEPPMLSVESSYSNRELLLVAVCNDYLNIVQYLLPLTNMDRYKITGLDIDYKVLLSLFSLGGPLDLVRFLYLPEVLDYVRDPITKWYLSQIIVHLLINDKLEVLRFLVSKNWYIPSELLGLDKIDLCGTIITLSNRMVEYLNKYKDACTYDC